MTDMRDILSTPIRRLSPGYLVLAEDQGVPDPSGVRYHYAEEGEYPATYSWGAVICPLCECPMGPVPRSLGERLMVYVCDCDGVSLVATHVPARGRRIEAYAALALDGESLGIRSYRGYCSVGGSCVPTLRDLMGGASR